MQRVGGFIETKPSSTRRSNMLLLQACLAMLLICQGNVEANVQYQPYLMMDTFGRGEQLGNQPDSPSQNDRQFFIFNFGGGRRQTTTITQTVTESSTTSAIFTCTVSTTACAGRRRRAVMSDLLEEQYLEPSSVNSIETTVLATDSASSNTRERRDADPQHYLPRPPYDIIGSRQRDGITVQPSISGYGQLANTGDYFWPSPYHRNYPVQAHDDQQDSRQWWSRPIVGAGRTTTVYFTTTRCFIFATTSTSTPACSVNSGFAQCPKAVG